MTDDFLRELYGPAIFIYTDSQAIADGILIPFVTTKRDTGHRITSNAWNELTEYHRKGGDPDYKDNDFYKFFYAELLPLAPYALKTWNESGILMTDFDFKVGKYEVNTPNVLWYEPNYNTPASVTMMLPQDH